MHAPPQHKKHDIMGNKWQNLLVVLFTAEDKVAGGLGDIIGRVDDLSGPEGNVRVTDQSTLTPQSLTGCHHLSQ